MLQDPWGVCVIDQQKIGFTSAQGSCFCGVQEANLWTQTYDTLLGWRALAIAPMSYLYVIYQINVGKKYQGVCLKVWFFLLINSYIFSVKLWTICVQVLLCHLTYEQFGAC